MLGSQPPPPCRQKEWQTPVKTIPCPKFHLQAVTRKHSSRMCTAYMCFSDHQMSSSERVWTGLQWWPPDVTNRIIPCSMSEGRPCTVRSSVRWVMVTWDPPPNRITDTCENIIFPQLRWRMVNIEPKKSGINDIGISEDQCNYSANPLKLRWLI